jgi:hypothetical protein
MKKLYVIIFMLYAHAAQSQSTVWVEDFITGSCGQGTLANGYTTSNGTWSVVSTGTNDPESNNFYISATENGNGTGNCGTGCGINRTLHVGANDGISPTDGGASYNAGGLCGIFYCVTSNWRAQSPVIDLTGEVGLSLSFNYMEFAQGTIDDATLWYYDGSIWSQLDMLAKTPCCGGPCNGSNQGQWTYFSIALPASASNNPDVKIGFNWTNNDDGVGTDPSFAVDDIQISSIKTSITENALPTFKVYPNPASEELNLISSYTALKSDCVVMDIANRTVKSVFHNNLPEQRINISQLSPGLYFIHLLNNEGKILNSAKFIKL